MSAHTWMEIGTLDNEGMRTHAIPGDVCVGCSDADVGRWVPVSQCPRALMQWEADHAEIATWEAEGGS